LKIKKYGEFTKQDGNRASARTLVGERIEERGLLFGIVGCVD
jgi:hypothetical protein